MENVVAEQKAEAGEFLHRLDKDEQKMVDNFENEYQCLVYHVLKSTGNLGFVYTFLIVTRNRNDWELQLAPYAYNGETATRALAYVINDAWKCREFGDVVIKVDAEGCAKEIL